MLHGSSGGKGELGLEEVADNEHSQRLPLLLESQQGLREPNSRCGQCQSTNRNCKMAALPKEESGGSGY